MFSVGDIFQHNSRILGQDRCYIFLTVMQTSIFKCVWYDESVKELGKQAYNPSILNLYHKITDIFQ